MRLTQPRTASASVDDVVAEHPRRSGVGTQQGGEHADGRRLAGTVRAEHAVDGARLHGEVDAVDRRRGAEPLDESLGLDRQVGDEWSMPNVDAEPRVPRPVHDAGRA